VGFLQEGEVRGRMPPSTFDPADELPMSELLRHPSSLAPPSRPQSAAHPRASRGEGRASRDVRMLEAALLAKLDGRAGTDSDMSRARVLVNLFGAVNPNGEQFATEPQFVQAIGRLALGASTYAGKRGGKPHMMIPAGWRFDIRHDTLAALFDKYAERIGDERVVDVEAMYAKLKRSVTPHGREATSLEMMTVDDAEQELLNHPYAPRSRASRP